jgi:hypothetical protein
VRYRHPRSDRRLSIDASWLPVHAALHHAAQSGTFHELTADRSLEFWIRPFISAQRRA